MSGQCPQAGKKVDAFPKDPWNPANHLVVTYVSHTQVFERQVFLKQVHL